MIYTDPKLAPGGAGPGDAPEPPPTVSAYTGMGDVPPPPGLGRDRRPARRDYMARAKCPPFRRLRCIPARRYRGRPPSSRDRRRRRPSTACCSRRPGAAAPPRRPVHRCLRKGCRHHDSHGSQCEAIGSSSASCLALALTGCAFQGLNSLPLPGAVGRGPDAVTYHVEVAECRDAGVEFAGHDQRRRRRQRRQDDGRRLARQRGDLGQARRRGACQRRGHGWADQPAGIDASGAQPAARRKAKRPTATRCHHSA